MTILSRSLAIIVFMVSLMAGVWVGGVYAESKSPNAMSLSHLKDTARNPFPENEEMLNRMAEALKAEGMAKIEPASGEIIPMTTPPAP